MNRVLVLGDLLHPGWRDGLAGPHLRRATRMFGYYRRAGDTAVGA